MGAYPQRHPKTLGKREWQKVLRRSSASTRKAAMPEEFDLEELRSELSEYAAPEKPIGRSAVEERVIAGFEGITRFVVSHGHIPRHGENEDIFERIYAIRLERLRKQEGFRKLLAPLDHQGLLALAPASSVGDEEPD